MYKCFGRANSEITDSVAPAIGLQLRRRCNRFGDLLLVEIPWESCLDLRFPWQTQPRVERREQLIAVHIEQNLARNFAASIAEQRLNFGETGRHQKIAGSNQGSL